MSQMMPQGFRGPRRGRPAPAPNCAPDALHIEKCVPYYSRVRLAFVQSGTTPNFIYTLPQGQQSKAFAYAQGQDMAAAGRAGTAAQACDTNITVASQTIDSDQVDIRGVAIQVVGAGAISDPALVIAALAEISVRLTSNGQDRSFLLGPCEMIPGGAGIYAGGAGSASKASGANVGSMTSGLPTFGNFFPVPAGWTWNPASAADSSLVIVFNPDRAVVVNVNNASAPANAFIDLRVQLISKQRARRSPNI